MPVVRLQLLLFVIALLPAVDAVSPADVFAAHHSAVVAITCDGPRGMMRYYGTGAVISAEGHVLSNITVVPMKARNIQVHFTDGRILPGRFVAADRDSEAALVRVDGTDLPYMPLVDSAAVAVGDPVLTWGNPHHTLENDGMVSFSRGIVSGRYVMASADDQSRYLGPVIEVDAAVNPGSDGGPVTDGHGRLIGVMSLGFSRHRWLGAAIPVNRMREGLAALAGLPLEPIVRADIRRHWPREATVQRHLPNVAQAVVSVLAVGEDDPEPPAQRPGSPTPVHGIPGNLQPRAERIIAQPLYATGTIIQDDGLILTTATGLGLDVGAIKQVVVYPADGARRAAELITLDPVADIALVRITAAGPWPHLPLAEAEAPKQAASVFLLGRSEAPGTATCTLGRVSATDRAFGIAWQTSALMNYGNIGGPVCDLRGRLVGIATWLGPKSDWRQNAGVGFLLHAGFLRDALPELLAKRPAPMPQRSFLGIRADPLSRDGVTIEAVVPGSGADKAGLRQGDVIIQIDGQQIDEWAQFSAVMEGLRPKQTVPFVVRRETRSIPITVTLGLFPTRNR